MEVLQEIAHKIGFDWQLAISHLINLLIIFFLLSKFAFPKIKKAIDDRNRKISDGLRIRDEADLVLKKAEESSKDILRDASQQKNSILESATNQGKQILSNATEDAQLIRNEANTLKEGAKNAGLKEAESLLSKDINKIVSEVVNMALDGKVTTKQNEEFVSKVFAQNYK